MRAILFSTVVLLSFMVNVLAVAGASTDQGVANVTTVQDATTVLKATNVQNATTVQNAEKVTTNAPPYATSMLILVVLILVLFTATPLEDSD